jgi:hypothetical protein
MLMRKAFVLMLGLVSTMVSTSILPAQAWLFPSPQAQSAPPAGDPALADSMNLYLPMMTGEYEPSYISPFGISMYGEVSAATGLDAMMAAGAGWVLTDLNWSEVQPVEGGPFDWRGPDAKVTAAAARGARLHVLFNNNPAWASASLRGPVYPDKLPALVAMVQAMVTRYSGNQGLPAVQQWAFYGEPDNLNAWGEQGASYAALLARLTPVVHQANPNAQVVLSSLAYDLFTDDEITTRPRGPFVRRFLPDVLSALRDNYGGVPANLDAVAFNFYPISTERWPTIRQKAAEIRTILTAYGAGALPLIVAEMSMWSMWPDGVERQQQQAQWLVQFYARGLSAGIQQLDWFQVFDVMPAYDGSTQGLFVGTTLGQPKQAYYAYQALTRQLSQAHYRRALSVAGVEGYVFGRRAGPDITVMWGTQTGASPVNFAQGCARVVDLWGGAKQVNDGGVGDLDAAANGSIRLGVAPQQPLYVEACR